MAVSGRKPKEDDQKVTRHQLTQGWVEVPDLPYEGERPALGRVPARTKAWWERCTTLPHCLLWTAGDWQFALDTAMVHAAFVKTGRGASELRVREKQMGTTLDARRDLRIRYVNPLAHTAIEEREHDDEVDREERLADFGAERRRRLLGVK